MTNTSIGDSAKRQSAFGCGALISAVAVSLLVSAGAYGARSDQAMPGRSSTRPDYQVGLPGYHIAIQVSTDRGASGEVSVLHACRDKAIEADDPRRYLNSAFREFKTKEIVVFFYPNPCANPVRLTQFLPRIVLIDNEKNPKEMTFVIHKRFYASSFRPRVHTSTVELHAVENVVQRFDRRLPFVGVLGIQDGGELTKDEAGKDVSRDLDSIYFGVNALEYSRETWSRFPKLAAHLENLKGSQIVDGNVVRDLAGELLGICGYGQSGVGENISCGGNFDGRSMTFPLSLSKGAWRIPVNREYGSERYIFFDRYLPKKQGCTWHAGSCDFNRHEFVVEIEGMAIYPGAFRWKYFYEFKSKALYFVMSRIFAIKTNEDAKQ